MRKAIYVAIALILLGSGIAVGIGLERTSPACHSIEEDSTITDCDYRNGAWYRK